MKSILIVINYFGTWPPWMSVFLESCARNPSITWQFHTDCPVPAEHPTNVRFAQTTLADYYQKASAALGIQFNPEQTYKICDLRPAYGVIYSDEIEGFDYYGYTDLDVIYGDIRTFITDQVLTHSLVSADSYWACGHFTLFRNDDDSRTAYQLIPHWKKYLEDPNLLPWEQRLNEYGLAQVFNRRHFFSQQTRNRWRISDQMDDVVYALCKSRIRRLSRSSYFKEQYSTPLTPNPWIDGSLNHPEVWYWKQGRIYNDLNVGREFMYLHLMNFKSPRYLNPKYGKKAFWQDLPNVLQFDSSEYYGQDVQIDRYGIHIMQPDR